MPNELRRCKESRAVRALAGKPIATAWQPGACPPIPPPIPPPARRPTPSHHASPGAHDRCFRLEPVDPWARGALGAWSQAPTLCVCGGAMVSMRGVDLRIAAMVRNTREPASTNYMLACVAPLRALDPGAWCKRCSIASMAPHTTPHQHGAAQASGRRVAFLAPAVSMCMQHADPRRPGCSTQ